MNIKHRSRSLRRVIVGGITTMVLAGSAGAFAGEAAAMPPRETPNAEACAEANALVAYLGKVYAENPAAPGLYEAYVAAKARAFAACHNW